MIEGSRLSGSFLDAAVPSTAGTAQTVYREAGVVTGRQRARGGGKLSPRPTPPRLAAGFVVAPDHVPERQHHNERVDHVADRGDQVQGRQGQLLNDPSQGG